MDDRLKQALTFDDGPLPPRVDAALLEQRALARENRMQIALCCLASLLWWIVGMQALAANVRLLPVLKGLALPPWIGEAACFLAFLLTVGTALLCAALFEQLPHWKKRWMGKGT